MTATYMGGNVKLFKASSPFKQRLVRRPPPAPPSYDDFLDEEADNVYEINPPRSVKLGVLLDDYTGEPIGRFDLPLHDELHEPTIAVIGSSGSGKTVTVSRLIDELRRTQGRPLLIFDAKSQYIEMNLPNQNPEMCKILEENGEKPEGVENLKVYIPKNMIKKYGEVICKDMFHYTNTWTIKTNDTDATSLLMLGQKSLSDRDYIVSLAGIVDNLRCNEREEGIPFTIDALNESLVAEIERIPQKKRSIEPLISMVDNLVQAGYISDDGNNVLELLHKPYTRVIQTENGFEYRTKKAGDVSVFNSCGSPQDIQTKALLTNLVNALCNKLIFQFDNKTRIPLYRPIIVIEEASTFYGKDSDKDMVSAINQLLHVVGRSTHCTKILVYQFRKQSVQGFFESDNINIIIDMQGNINLKDPITQERTGRNISKKGLALVQIRNCSFMPNMEFLVQILPSKCQVKT